jgi:hypothetical protein
VVRCVSPLGWCQGPGSRYIRTAVRTDNYLLLVRDLSTLRDGSGLELCLGGAGAG